MTTSVKHFAETPSTTSEQIDYILLDGSSSMHNQWYDVLNSIDAYIDETKKATELSSQVLFAVFSSQNTHKLVRDLPIREWVSLREDPIECPGGTTPLYTSIVQLGMMLRDINPPRASVVIATDGEATDHEMKDQARAVLDWMKAKGWQVTFIGCDWDNSDLANRLGMAPTQAIGVGKRHLSSATRELAKKRTAYGRSGAPIHWSDEEKQNFGGYLK